MNIGGMAISGTGALFIFVFGLIGFGLLLFMAKMSRNFISWSYSGAGVGFVAGFVTAIFAIVVLLNLGQGVLKSILSWKNAPGPIGGAIDSSRASLQNVLGSNTEVCEIK